MQPDLTRLFGRHYQRKAGINPADFSLAEAAYFLQSRQLTSTELVNACLSRIDERNGLLNAWVRVYREDSIKQAFDADRLLRSNRPSPILTGIPIGVKDLIAVKDKPLTGGSHVLDGHICPDDAPAWGQLRAAGAVLLGHTTSLEFGLGDVAPQTVKNPWNLLRSPGGSSNGSGAALCARMIPGALGTDGAGSTRRPAAALNLCGMIGTWGRVPVRGMLSSDFTYDHIAPMARNAVDLSLLMSSMISADLSDPGTLIAPVLDFLPYIANTSPKPLKGLRFEVIKGDSFGGLAPGVDSIFTRFQQELILLGAAVVEVTEPPFLGYGHGPGPTSVLLHKNFYATNPQGYSEPIRAKIGKEQANANVPTAINSFEDAQARANYIALWKEVFVSGDVDFLLAACVNTEIPLLDSNPDGLNFGNPNIRRNFNIIGMPAICIQTGFSPDTNMPVGIQIIGDHWDDADVIQVALDYQAKTSYHQQVPFLYL